MSVYREAVPVFEDVRDWDVVIVHGSVRIVGWVGSHLSGCPWEEFGRKCWCFKHARFSSPVVDSYGRELEVQPYRGSPVTDAARHLLSLGPGSEIRVLSGKTYRLVGPRRGPGRFPGDYTDLGDPLADRSIWIIYMEEEVLVRWWLRIAEFIGLRGKPRPASGVPKVSRVTEEELRRPRSMLASVAFPAVPWRHEDDEE
jgi:hypothetical protein